MRSCVYGSVSRNKREASAEEDLQEMQGKKSLECKKVQEMRIKQFEAQKG